MNQQARNLYWVWILIQARKKIILGLFLEDFFFVELPEFIFNVFLADFSSVTSKTMPGV